MKNFLLSTWWRNFFLRRFSIIYIGLLTYAHLTSSTQIRLCRTLVLTSAVAIISEGSAYSARALRLHLYIFAHILPLSYGLLPLFVSLGIHHGRSGIRLHLLV